MLAAWSWESWDTWIVLLGAVTAMSCTLPGVWLVLRRQSMMGDALSHTALPGVVITFLLAQQAVASQRLSEQSLLALEPFLLAMGAVVIGVVTALLTEWLQRWGRIDGNAALGVVFTSLFALGLLLVRLKADSVHIDPDCVLFGQLELAVWDTVIISDWEIPRAFLSNLGLLLFNGILMLLFFKELRISAFDPEQATSLGLNARLVNSLIISATALTVVMAFSSVGSILVVAILIVPAACGFLACDRLGSMIGVSLVVAALSTVVGHILAKAAPPLLGTLLGIPHLQDASTPGMIAVACGIFFLGFSLFAPRHGLLAKWFDMFRLRWKMAADDLLGTLFRLEEVARTTGSPAEEVRASLAWISPAVWKMTLLRLRRRGWIQPGPLLQLTPEGRREAADVVRGHRLWESYLFKNFDLDGMRLHESADRVEHYLNRELRTQLEEELDSPRLDPHGKTIPPQEPDSGPAV